MVKTTSKYDIYVNMIYKYIKASLVPQTVKNPPVMQETWFQSLGWEDTLEESMTTQYSILAWRIPIDRSLSMGSHKYSVTNTQTQLSN